MRRAVASVLGLVPRTEFSAHYASTYSYIPCYERDIKIFSISLSQRGDQSTIELCYLSNRANKILFNRYHFRIHANYLYVTKRRIWNVIGFRDHRCLKYRPLSRYTETSSKFSSLPHGTYNCLQK